MQESRPRILIISSADPTIGPGVLASDYYKAYKSQGYVVDLLTLYRCEQYPEFLYVYEKRPKNKYIDKLVQNPLDTIKNSIRYRLGKPVYPFYPYFFFYKEEKNAPVSVEKILNVVSQKYDFVHILFWQHMLSFATVLALYRKLKCKFFFNCMDYSPMAGGCHFIGECERYKYGCGCCPAYGSSNPHDFTWHNVNYRKLVYDEVDPVVSGNSYMFNFYDQSVLLKGRKRLKSYPIIDLSVFKPLPKEDIRTKLGISTKKYILLFGCQGIDDERKGVKYLIEGVRKFADRLSDIEREQLLVMAIGNSFSKIKSQFGLIDTLDLGYVSISELPSLYSAADVFLCSSVNDAGPMMVFQSLCCGTPVVGFEMGACLEAVKDRGTGYCAKLKDTDDYASGIEFLFRLTPQERMKMSATCVEFARNTNSYEAAVKRVISAYYM